MTPETAQFLAKAQKLLQEAEAIEKINLNDMVGRTAYLAGFHAAQTTKALAQAKRFVAHLAASMT